MSTYPVSDTVLGSISFNLPAALQTQFSVTAALMDR